MGTYGLSRSWAVFALAAVCICVLSIGVSEAAEGSRVREMLASDPDVGSSFEYEGRGRDIFTYGEAPKDLPKEARTILDEGIPRLKGVPRPPVDGDKLLREAYASYWKATGDFLEHDYLDAVKECEKALGRLERAGRSDSDLALDVARLRRASAELGRRNEVEKEFHKVDLDIESIAHNEGSRAAVVNGHVVTEGQTVAGTGASILSIGRAHIVFLYKGYKVRKEMFERK